MSDVWLLRLGILLAGVLLLVLIYVFGRPPKTPSQRREPAQRTDEKTAKAGKAKPKRARREPVLKAAVEADAPSHAAVVDEDSVPPQQYELAVEQGFARPQQEERRVPDLDDEIGRRPQEGYEKIVTLYVAARAGQQLHGDDIWVAAEKAGLTFGYMRAFHRMIEGQPQRGPVFSVANVIAPGTFDDMHNLQTPAIAFFLTLPAPVGALDGWEMMVPTAQRMTELLDGVLLDESRNTLSRQRIQMIREEMRSWDREQEALKEAQTPKPKNW